MNLGTHIDVALGASAQSPFRCFSSSREVICFVVVVYVRFCDRMALLHRRCLIRCKDRIDHWQQRPQLRLRRQLLARLSGS